MKCLFCYSENIREASYPRPTKFNGKTFHYKQCFDCDLIFIDPLPDVDDYKKMYEKTYHDEFYFKEAPDYTNWLELFEKFSKEKSVVDYGCGDGSFVKFFNEKGYNCTGVEYDPELVVRLRSAHPNITFYTVDEFWKLDPLHQFNAIFMGDVLEHLDTPADFLKKLFARIKTGGLITAQGPLENNENIALGFRKLVSEVKSVVVSDSIATHIPYHISFANAQNLENLLERSGLSTLYYHVFETTWPFPSKFSNSPSDNVKHLVAKASIALSQAYGGKFGNRFMYVGEKK